MTYLSFGRVSLFISVRQFTHCVSVCVWLTVLLLQIHDNISWRFFCYFFFTKQQIPNGKTNERTYVKWSNLHTYEIQWCVVGFVVIVVVVAARSRSRSCAKWKEKTIIISQIQYTRHICCEYLALAVSVFGWDCFVLYHFTLWCLQNENKNTRPTLAVDPSM